MLGGLVVSIGVALAGVLAIAFSLSLFLQQSVSNLYSPQYFPGYSFDGKQQSVFMLVLSIVLTQLGYGLYLGTLDDAPVPLPMLVLVGTFSLTGIVFSLLLWQYLHVARKTTPVAAIQFLCVATKRRFDVLHKQAIRTAWLLNLRSGGNHEQILAQVYASIVPDWTETLLGPVSALCEVTMRLSTRGDHVAANHGVRGLTDILSEYFSRRRSSSLVLPSQAVPLANVSDSQSLLDRTLERLNAMGEEALRGGRGDNARGIVDSYAALVGAAVKVEFLNRQNENPIVAQLDYYLKSYVDTAVRLKDNEVPFRAIETFARIGQHGAVQGDATLVYSAAQHLGAVGVSAAGTGAWFIAERCCVAQVGLLRSLFVSPGDGSTGFDKVLRELFFVHEVALVCGNNAASSLSTTTVLRKPFDELQLVLKWVLEQGNNLSGQQDLSVRLRLFAEVLYRHLRPLCETIDLTASYVDAVAELIFQTIRALHALESDKQRTTWDGIGWFVALPGWFGERSQEMKSPRGLEHAIDAACKVALMLIEQDGPFRRVLAAMDTQYTIVKRALERNTGGGGYYELRLMLRICFCGVLATKHGLQYVVAKACGHIEEFDSAWGAKRGSAPDTPSLTDEFVRWRGDVEEHHTPGLAMGDPGDIVASGVQVKDVDTFLAEAWGWRVSGYHRTGLKLWRVGTRAELRERLMRVLRRRLDEVGR